MVLDVSRYRNKVRKNTPRFNMVPFIDVVFTILIFLMVTSSFGAADQTQSASGKPQVTQSSGTSEYYLVPVAGLKKVTVNGQDMSSYIRNGAIAVHTRVIDEGEIIIRSKAGEIIITTPAGFPINKAVSIPTQ
ncbi:ExbD/TolR family protein [Methanobacterium sp.]|uniref:ExbD/TolR family protein n=1 Tax=Methanobacterium sp. TaxID=2164 RepID=UPI003C773A18